MGIHPLKPCANSASSALSNSNRKATVRNRVFPGSVVFSPSWWHGLALFVVSVAALAMAGCGAGGYAGGSISGLSASAITIDAGQSYTVTVELDQSPLVTWTLSGATCSTAGCGTVSNANGAKTTYTAPAGLTAPIAVTLTAAVTGTSSAAKLSITVNPDPTLNGVPPNGTVGTTYTASLNPTGGTAPLSLSITSGTLPPGVTFNATTGVLSGTPTTNGTFTFTVQLIDSSAVPYTLTKTETVVISSGGSTPTALTLSSNNLPDGYVKIPYSEPIPLAGGTTPYACTLAGGGALPAGLSLSSGCIVSGVPTTAGTFTFNVTGTDASSPQETITGPVTITIHPGLTISPTLPSGTVSTPYSQTVGVSGGTAPYTCTITSGTLPAGLSMNSSCLVSGTPTLAGSATVTVTASDSGNPKQMAVGPVNITINNPVTTTLTLTSPPNGTVDIPYNGSVGVGGGNGPYTCIITGLPAGLTATGCVITGTPATAGNYPLMVTATDSTGATTTGTVSLIIGPPTATLTLSNPPAGTVNVAYTGGVGVSGGTTPYTCSITGLPTGLTSNNCAITGTPTSAGTYPLTVTATDSTAPTKLTTTGTVQLVIGAPTALTLSNPPAGTVDIPYTGSVGVGGGTAPYTCSITGLPTGLTSNSCAIIGTPATAGTYTLNVTATDSSSPTKLTTTGTVQLVIGAPTAILTLSNPPAGTVNVVYTGSVGVNGGTPPYTCSITGLPTGLTSNNCAISGTPTTAGTYPLTVTATDSTSPTKLTTTGTVQLVINGITPLALNGTLPNATLGVAYSSTLTASGGISPYTYTVTSGSLPPGLTLGSSTGTVSGTPTTVGAYSFTITATDSESPVAKASKPFVVQVLYPCTANCPALKGPYAYLFQGYDDVVAGVLAYQTATVASFTADGAAGISAGEMDSNHQTAPATGIVKSVNFVGTYTLGTDYRGSLTLTVVNADGTVGATTTYAIAVKAPVSPATTTAQGSLIEADNNQLVGTKGSGTLLQQTSSAFSAGLQGSYAFGLQGDTPCIIGCPANLGAGPVATVGEFTVDGAGAISNGLADTNVAARTSSNATVAGIYSGADGNGRMTLSLSAASSISTFPTDYAVYMVNANQVFIMSTDTHAAYILQAGTATARTQTTFSNASLNGPFIGYENSYTNPGLVGATLQNVLNLSTATIFRGVGASNATCNITNVDVGGVTSLLSGLTGILGSATGLSSLLGETAYTGSTTCTVASNGRAILQYPVPTLLGIPLFSAPAPRVLYLTSPNTGYFLETGYAGLGKLEAQTGSPFSEANTFNGTYVYGTAPASSLASIDDSGVIVSNGSGSADTTTDTNVGVGTINVIQIGNTSTQTYTAPDATTGRFTLGTGGTTVLYAITPNRFVLLDTSALTTSPSVTLLY